MTYLRCGPALWRQPRKFHKQTHMDHTRKCSRSAKTARLLHFSRPWSVAIHWYTYWSWLMPRCKTNAAKRFQFKSLKRCCLSNQQHWPKPGMETMSLDRYMFTITSVDKAFAISEVRWQKVWWLTSSCLFIVTTSAEVWCQICCAKYFW